MNDVQRRKFRQKMQQATDQQFWEWMNVVHFNAYQTGQKHILEAMSCHPRISKKMVGEVEEKGQKIREEWDGMKTVELEFSIDKLLYGRERVCPHCQKTID
ncbi:hypothetical protein [Gorillibacterium sp. sgz5001074]|uniref:hypothetical protein n=1 Tax=Gorillibacterium sp. sgz5001074 TaxID=3446695 RepID=UPI003F67E3FD